MTLMEYKQISVIITLPFRLLSQFLVYILTICLKIHLILKKQSILKNKKWILLYRSL